jgi:pyruvate dehydrogenase E1 component
MIPFYIYYSMFGFQRIGDFAWAGGDSRARGFLIGGTAGRTTLAGEGLQHQDGHSQLVATTIPNCRAYDPCFNYELAVIIQDGLRRMCKEQESIFYYITCMNENYVHPAMPAGAESGILRGIYKLQAGGKGKVRVQLLGSGTILRETVAAAALLQETFGIPADVWSVTSFSELRRDALDVERWNERHPDEPRKSSYVAEVFAEVKTVPDQIRRWIPGRFAVLGTDGFGRSDSRAALRDFFEVDRKSIALAALNALAEDGSIDRKTVGEAIAKLGIDPDKPNPVTV